MTTFPSGVWRGFWEQPMYGRQPMEAFELHFRGGFVEGHGVDVVGRFTFGGEYDDRTGTVRMVKHYVNRDHEVHYDGKPDGEGNILGTWTIRLSWGSTESVTRGPFVLTPALPRPRGDEPIAEIRK